ncbi:MAG: hypothetical protein V4710_20160 [Verrucomicrobiota bacterium]
MRTFIIAMILAFSSLAHAGPKIPRSTSPNRQYSVRLGDNSTGPIVEVINLKSRVLGETEYPMDASEKFPIVLWSPKSTSVALTSKQLHYTLLSVLHYSPKKKRFLELEIPDLVALSGGRIKSIDELRPSAFVAARKWIDDQTLLVQAGMLLLGPAGDELSLEIRLRLRGNTFTIESIKELPN